MTKNEVLLISISEPMIGKVIKDMENGTKRSIRNAIALGAYFSKEDIPKEFFAFSKKIFNKPDSIYFKWITKVINNVDEKILKCLSVNVGVLSFLIGSKKIQKTYNNSGAETMWHKSFDINKIDNIDKFKQDIGTLQKKGIYIYILENITDDNNLLKACTLANLYKKCTFCLNIETKSIDESTLVKLSNCNNMILSINDSKCNDNHNLFSELKKHKLFFGFSHSYPSQNFNPEKDTYLQSMLDEGCLFALYLDNEDNKSDYNNNVYRCICNSRVSSNLPIILCDFFRDSQYIMEVMLHKKNIFNESIS